MACFLTTYCSLECHQKHWMEGHRRRCNEIRSEFVEVVLKPDLDGLETSCPKLCFIIQVVKNARDNKMLIFTEDDSVMGDVFRLAGQEEVYDQILKVVEEQGLVEEVDETGAKAGTFQKVYHACFIARFEGQTEEGDMKLKINAKQVQPMVTWF